MAVVVTVIFVILRLYLDPFAPGKIRLLFLGVAISSWYGGFGPGLVSSLLSLLAHLVFFMSPDSAFSFDYADYIEMFFYLFVAISISALSDSLIKAKQAALALAEQKEQLLASISHEIRTPLNSIIGLTRLLSETNISLQQSDYLKNLQKSSKLLLKLVNDFLDYSKFQNQKISLEKENFNLIKELQYLVELFSEKAKEKNIEIHLTVVNSLPDQLYGDAERFNQIMINLIDNAIKFSNNNQIKIEVRGSHFSGNAVNIEVSIEDFGIGISFENQKKIFEPFVQIENTSKKNPGTGLGLSIVQRTIKLMNGNIFVQSELGKGSKFTLSIPFEVPAKKVETKFEEKTKQTFSQSIRILIVEDDEMSRFVLSQMLLQEGFYVDVAVDGIEATHYLKSYPYDIVFMDCQMPSISGYETTHIIRKDLALKIPIVAVTADTSHQNIQKCLKSGMNDCLFKPIQKDELEYILNRWLKINATLQYNEQIITKEIVENFLSNIPERLDLLKYSIENQDKDLLGRVAHGFISASGALGVTKISTICQSLENQAKKENFKEAKTLFNELCSELVTAQEHLQEKHHLNL